MKFKEYLIEKSINDSNTIVYHKLLSRLDSAHITVTNDSYEFSVGRVIDDSSLIKFIVKVQKSENNTIEFKKDSDNYILIISVSDFPKRSDIDRLFSTNNTLMIAFKNYLSKFRSLFNRNDEIPLSKSEKEIQMYDRDNVETSYQKLTDSIKLLKTKFDESVDDIKKQEESTVNKFKKSTLHRASEKLKEDMFGSTQKEFIKKMLKLPEAEFIEYLDKDMKNKILSRLQNYYNELF